MKKKRLITIVAACVVAVAAITVIVVYTMLSKRLEQATTDNETYNAAEFTALNGSFTDKLINDEESARLAIEEVADSLGIKDVSSELSQCRTDSALGNTYYRFSQSYQGIPVYGRDMIVAADQDGKVLMLSGNYRDVSPVDVNPDFSENDAVETVKEMFGDESTVNSEGLTIYSLGNNDPELSWQIYVSTSDVLEYCFVSAEDGQVIQEEPLKSYQTICGGVDVDGESQNFYAEYENGEYILKDTSRDISIYDANNGTVKADVIIKDSNGNLYYSKGNGEWTNDNGDIFSIEGETVFSLIIKGSDGNIIDKNGECLVRISTDGIFSNIEPITSKSEIWENDKAVTLISRLSVVYDYWDAVFGRHSFDGKYGAINGVINDNINGDETNAITYSKFGVPIATISFGIKNQISQNEVSHEFAHAVESTISGLAYSGESGAIKEACSDVFSKTVEAWENDGIYDWNYDGGRNIAKPGSDELPDTYRGDFWVDTSDTSSGNDYGGVHDNSTVISHAAYMMNDGIGSNPNYEALSMEDIANLFYATLHVLPPDCTFSQFRVLMENTANILNKQGLLSDKQADCVSNAFFQVGVDRTILPVSKDVSINVFSENGDPYEDYTLYLSYGSEEQEYAGSEINGEKLRLENAGLYGVYIVDNFDDNNVIEFTVDAVDNGGAKNIPVYTMFKTKVTEDLPENTPTPTAEPTPTLTTGPTPTVAPASPDMVRDEFMKFITDGTYEALGVSWDIRPEGYAFIDIDQDSVEELVLNAAYDDDFSTAAVFKINTSDQSITNIGQFDYCYDLKYSQEYKALVYYKTRPSAMETIYGFYVIQDGILTHSFSVSYGQVYGVEYDDPTITQYTDELRSVAFTPLSDLLNETEPAENNKVELSGYLNDFASLQSLLQGTISNGASEYSEYRIAENGGIQYAKYNDSQQVDYIVTHVETGYQIYGVYVGQDVSLAKDTLSGSGWALSSDGIDSATYSSGLSNIIIYWDNSNRVTMVLYYTSN